MYYDCYGCYMLFLFTGYSIYAYYTTLSRYDVELTINMLNMWEIDTLRFMDRSLPIDPCG